MWCDTVITEQPLQNNALWQAFWLLLRDVCSKEVKFIVKSYFNKNWHLCCNEDIDPLCRGYTVYL